MKNLFKSTWAICAVASVAMLASCSADDGEEGNVVKFTASGSVDATEVLEAYAEDVVITRYENLAEKAGALYTAAQAITPGSASESTQISAAADAWVKTRLAWERTEAYLFGPVDLYKIDPGIDSWPLALADLAEFITSYTEYQIQNDNGEKKGFHTIEFLLFEDGSAKSALTDFNSSEISSSYNFGSLSGDEIKSFLVAITKELYYNTILLVAEWDSIENATIATDAELLGVKTNNGGGYYDDFTTAGDEESSYSSLSDALSVILESAAGIADEVGAVKINDPYVSKNVLDVESWFSWNSVYDFTDNIIGIKEAYYGKLFDGTSTEYSSSSISTAASASISAYVASGSTSLDTAVKTAIENAITKVSALPYPFRNYLNDVSEAATIEAAMEACEELLAALETAQMAVNDGYYIE
ncbi:MAG: imelysin family protein [Rikenellaceae bacterium]